MVRRIYVGRGVIKDGSARLEKDGTRARQYSSVTSPQRGSSRLSSPEEKIKLRGLYLRTVVRWFTAAWWKMQDARCADGEDLVENIVEEKFVKGLFLVYV